jgi:D-alanyl-D-alanine carboxypeptidase
MNDILISIHRDLGITAEYLEANRLSLQAQPSFEDLKVVDIDFEGKPFVLYYKAARGWRDMTDEARRDGVCLMPFSGFRSYLHQKSLIDRHLKNGRLLESILTHIAIPGFSEHHSGRAIDIHVKGKAVLDEGFENTIEFRWLMENASRFEFRLSYPKSNSYGIIYEPWHWFFVGD